jgi:BirA family transcriptional regulator, biotin operon repressor / biotin---[acetyl-CoA-carboxylase] ligase
VHNFQNTLFIGKKRWHFDTLPSTNTFAAELLVSKTKPPDGTLVSTTQQTAGRGQIGSIWASEPDKNVTASVILYPQFLAARQQFELSKAVACAVCECVAHFCPDKKVAIKWSNDIYIETQKVCGVLIQNTISGVFLQNSIVGIGINVNQVEFSSMLNATSLALKTGVTFNIEEVLETLCRFLEFWYLRLKAGKYQEIHAFYIKNLYRYQEKAVFQLLNDDFFTGTIVGVSPEGRLLIENEYHEVLDFGIKEVRFEL